MSSSRALFESGVLLCFLLAFISLVSEGQFAALYGKNGLVPLKQLNDEGLLFSSISSSDNVDSAAHGRSFSVLYRKTFDLMRTTNYNVVWLAAVLRFQSYEKFMECVLYLGVTLTFYWLMVDGRGRGGSEQRVC